MKAHGTVQIRTTAIVQSGLHQYPHANNLDHPLSLLIFK